MTKGEEKTLASADLPLQDVKYVLEPPIFEGSSYPDPLEDDKKEETEKKEEVHSAAQHPHHQHQHFTITSLRTLNRYWIDR